MTPGDRSVEKPERLTSALSNVDTEQQLRAENEHLVDLQRAWEEAVEQYAELFMASPVPSLTIDPSGSIRKTNQAAAELLGNDVVGHPLRHRIEAADRRRCIDFVTESRKAEAQAVWCELKVLARDGATLPMRLSARWLKAPGSLALVTFTDLTARDEAIAQQQRLLQNEQAANSGICLVITRRTLASSSIRLPWV